MGILKHQTNKADLVLFTNMKLQKWLDNFAPYNNLQTIHSLIQSKTLVWIQSLKEPALNHSLLKQVAGTLQSPNILDII